MARTVPPAIRYGPAAVLGERHAISGLRVGGVFTGGNVDAGMFARVLDSKGNGAS
jgi:hypothetical protein